MEWEFAGRSDNPPPWDPVITDFDNFLRDLNVNTAMLRGPEGGLGCITSAHGLRAAGMFRNYNFPWPSSGLSAGTCQRNHPLSVPPSRMLDVVRQLRGERMGTDAVPHRRLGKSPYSRVSAPVPCSRSVCWVSRTVTLPTMVISRGLAPARSHAPMMSTVGWPLISTPSP